MAALDRYAGPHEDFVPVATDRRAVRGSGPPNQHWLVGSRSDPTLGARSAPKRCCQNQSRALPDRGPQRAFFMSRSLATATRPALVSRSAGGRTAGGGRYQGQSPWLVSIRLRVGIACAVLAIAVSARAQQKPLTIDAIYDTQNRVDFSGTPPTDVTWLDDTHYLLVRRAPGGRGFEWLKVEASNGRSEPLFDTERMTAALAAIPGVTREDASSVIRTPGSLTLNASKTSVLLTLADDLFVYDFGTGRVTRLTSTPGAEELATFSPDGRLVAFVRGNNLFVTETATPHERAITTDGSADILNGKLDWVYQEEIYGRGEFRAYWWSPDSSRLAFLQLNDAPVPRYTVVDHIPYHPALEVTSYPKAGDPNPLVKLGVARVIGGEPHWVDLNNYSPIEFLIVKVDW